MFQRARLESSSVEIPSPGLPQTPSESSLSQSGNAGATCTRCCRSLCRPRDFCTLSPGERCTRHVCRGSLLDRRMVFRRAQVLHFLPSGGSCLEGGCCGGNQVLVARVVSGGGGWPIDLAARGAHIGASIVCERQQVGMRRGCLFRRSAAVDRGPTGACRCVCAHAQAHAHDHRCTLARALRLSGATMRLAAAHALLTAGGN